MNRLIIGLGVCSPATVQEEMELLLEIGWDGFFSGWRQGEDLEPIAKKAQELGLFYHSVHAPFGHVERIWDEGDEGERVADELIECMKAARRVGVALMIVHAIKGLEKCTPTALGLTRFGRVFAEAERQGVTIALENTEGEVYLEALMREYGASDRVRFCIDTGHELCYNWGNDLIGKYGDKLVSTHLNDNLGVTGDAITWLDDAHLLPFDGIADWEGIAKRLRKAGYYGDLTFELTRDSKPGRNTHLRYAHLDCRGFLSLALERAKTFRVLMNEKE